MKKISKLMITIFILLNTACGTNKVSDKLINTNAIKTEDNGICEQTGSLNENGNVTKDIKNTSDSTVVTNNNKKDKNLNNHNDNQLKNETKNSNNIEDIKPEEQMINITIAIDCKTILDNLEDLKSGYRDYLPKNGIILDSAVLKIKKNSSVLDVLETVNQKYNLSLKDRKSPYGTYVCGIANIEEKICGQTSGWMYSVNGVFPGQSASSYRLKDGDKIKWRFTCKPGDLN
ncbi:MAG: DUF4430 domain-containing protein [Thomasclavelia sp.]